MSVFGDDKPKIYKNSFTLEEASEVFKEAAKKIEDGSLPVKSVDLVLQLTGVVASILKIFANQQGD